jgi:hypothetical protein
MKYEFYKNNVIFGDTIAIFSPNIAVSQKSFNLTYKKSSIMAMKQSSKQREMYGMRGMQRISSSLESINRSFESSLNKTTEIVHKKEDTFLNRIVLLFEENGSFKLKH